MKQVIERYFCDRCSKEINGVVPALLFQKTGRTQNDPASGRTEYEQYCVHLCQPCATTILAKLLDDNRSLAEFGVDLRKCPRWF
jgi:hypothetical protein